MKNSVPCLFAANDKQLWITYLTMVTNVNDAAHKRLIFELSALHDYGYSETYILLIFFTREFLALKPLNHCIFFLMTILIMAVFNFQF